MEDFRRARSASRDSDSNTLVRAGGDVQTSCLGRLLLVSGTSAAALDSGAASGASRLRRGLGDASAATLADGGVDVALARCANAVAAGDAMALQQQSETPFVRPKCWSRSKEHHMLADSLAKRRWLASQLHS